MTSDNLPRGAHGANDSLAQARGTAARRFITPDFDDDDEDDDWLDQPTLVLGSRGIPFGSQPPENGTAAAPPRFGANGDVPPPTESGWHPVKDDPSASAGLFESRRREAPTLPTVARSPEPVITPVSERDLASEPVFTQTFVGKAPDPITVSDLPPVDHQRFTRKADTFTTNSPPALPDSLWRDEPPVLTPPPSPTSQPMSAPSPSPVSKPPKEPTPVREPRRGRVPLAVAAIGLLIGALFSGYLLFGRTVPQFSRPETTAPTAGATASTGATQLTADDLVSSADLSGIAATEWAVQRTESQLSIDSPQPLCITSQTGSVPLMGLQRQLTSGNTTVLHRILGFVSADAATSTFAAQSTQLGDCANLPAYIVSGTAMTGLGDQAVTMTAVIQDPTPVFHTIVLSRTGSVVNVLDIYQPSSGITSDVAASVAAAAINRQCGRLGGGCAQSATVSQPLPPAGIHPGWLSVSDLPRINAGYGRWRSTDPQETIKDSLSSACENVTFATVQGPVTRQQNTYLLSEDPNLPPNFGVDELVLTFDSAEAALDFATNTLQKNIADCANRAPTAKLGTGGQVTTVGANNVPVTGFWQSLTQQTPAGTFLFRVGVAVADNKVVYVLATPSTGFDFSDEAWAQLTARAGARVTQLP